MDVTKLHTVKDALYMLYNTLDEANPESICKAYNKLKMHSDNSILQHFQEVGNKDSLNAHDLEDWVNLDNALQTTEQMSDKQNLATITRHSNENESSNEEDDSPEEKHVSKSEVAKCACPGWKENNVDPLQVMQLCRMMDFAM